MKDWLDNPPMFATAWLADSKPETLQREVDRIITNVPSGLNPKGWRTVVLAVVKACKEVELIGLVPCELATALGAIRAGRSSLYTNAAKEEP